MDIEITETLSAAKSYLGNLNSLKCEIQCAEKQILTTFKETQKNTVETFFNLKKFLNEILNKREKELLGKAEKVKNDGMVPIKECLTEIERNIQSTENFIKQGNLISKPDINGLTAFLEKASLLGNLPEVPELKEVPYLSFYYEPCYENDLKTLCLNFGEVFRIAPIQIKSLSSKPGAILVEWQQKLETEEKIIDIQEFRLQRTLGDVVKDKNLVVNFIDCYKGLDTQFLLRDIQISQPYSFRICCKFDGTSEWSPWSVPQVGLTNLRWFSWKNTDGFVLSNENKIACPLEGGNFIKILFSEGAQVSLQDSVEFTILAVDPKTEAILGLVTKENRNVKNLKDFKEGSFLVNNNGRIFVNGTEKSTVLPHFAKGLKVCFSLEKIHENKIRVNVDSSDKRVTYDWSINDNDTCKLCFACQMASCQWKVMVE